MNKEYRCLKCGWFKRTTEDLDLECPLCQEGLQVEFDTEEQDEKILKLIQEDEIEQMKWRIRTDGSNNVWNLIEAIKNPFARAEKRVIFIKAGGVVPRNFEIRT